MQARALRQGLLAAFFGTGGFFLALEVLLRLGGYGPDDIPHGYSPDLIGDFLPDKRHIARHPPPADHAPYRFDTNKQGLRADQEYALPKPVGIRRLLVLGDSFTFGPFVDNDELTTARLQSLLNRQSAVDSFEVVNAAMSGWTLIDQAEYLREKGLRLQPDLVAVTFYINDVREFHPFFRATLSRQTYRDQGRAPLFKLQLFLRRYSATYHLLRDIKDHFDLAAAANTLPDISTHDYRPFWPAYLEQVDALAALLQEKRIPLLFVLIPEGSHPTAPDWPLQNAVSADSLNQQLATADRAQGNQLLHSNALLPLLRDALTQRGIAYVDLLDLFARLPSIADAQALYLWPHDHHLSPHGHLFAAETIAAYLQRHPLPIR